MFKWGLVGFLIGSLLSFSDTVRAADLSEQDLADIRRAEDHMNDLISLKGQFLQINDSGSIANGTVWLSRPKTEMGRLRLEYDPPDSLLVVVDGSFLIVDDKELGEPSYIPLSSTPAGVILEPNLQLNADGLKVLEVQRDAGVIGFKIVQADEPEQGDITLVFSEKPFLLRQWTVRDLQNNYTTVSLSNVQRGLDIDPQLFIFDNPDYQRHLLPFEK